MKRHLIFTFLLFFFFETFSQQIGDGYAPALTDFSNLLTSGVYGGCNPNGKVPDESHAWQHLLVVRHANTLNNHQLQLASSYAVNDRIFFRKIVGGLTPIHTSWIELATRTSNTFTGNQTFLGQSTNLSNTFLSGSNTAFSEILIGRQSFEGVLSIAAFTGNFSMDANAGDFIIRNEGGGRKILFNTNAGQSISSMCISGQNVLIGKTTQTTNGTRYRLDVEGPIRAHEIVVNTTGADFVFEPSYKLRSLSELESFIKENKHLPDIAPAREMQENGVNSGEMHAKLLQKVEELTLYLIEKDKQLADQQKLLIELKKEIEILKSR